MEIYLILLAMLSLGGYTHHKHRLDVIKLKKENAYLANQVGTLNAKVDELGFLYNRQAVEFMKHMTYLYHGNEDEDTGKIEFTNAQLTTEQEFSLKKLETELNVEAVRRGYPSTSIEES